MAGYTIIRREPPRRPAPPRREGPICPQCGEPATALWKMENGSGPMCSRCVATRWRATRKDGTGEPAKSNPPGGAHS